MMHLLDFVSEDTNSELPQNGGLAGNHPGFLWDPLGHHKNTVWEVNGWSETCTLQPQRTANIATVARSWKSTGLNGQRQGDCHQPTNMHPLREDSTRGFTLRFHLGLEWLRVSAPRGCEGLISKTQVSLPSRKQEVEKGAYAVREHVDSRNRNFTFMQPGCQLKFQRDLTLPFCLSLHRQTLAVTIATNASNGTFSPIRGYHEMCSLWKTHTHTLHPTNF